MKGEQGMAKEVDGCVKPAAGPLAAAAAPTEQAPLKEETKMTMARTGKEAPDFEATAYVAGEGFRNVRLSDYRGQWVVVCFYPGDFTFV
jgi:peroxiredoxin (alkyl hydroperoxide reductase subunit C)